MIRWMRRARVDVLVEHRQERGEGRGGVAADPPGDDLTGRDVHRGDDARRCRGGRTRTRGAPACRAAAGSPDVCGSSPGSRSSHRCWPAPSRPVGSGRGGRPRRPSPRTSGRRRGAAIRAPGAAAPRPRPAPGRPWPARPQAALAQVGGDRGMGPFGLPGRRGGGRGRHDRQAGGRPVDLGAARERGRSNRPGTPRRANRARQVRTVGAAQPSAAAIAAFAVPSAAVSTILARSDQALLAVPAATIRSSFRRRLDRQLHVHRPGTSTFRFPSHPGRVISAAGPSGDIPPRPLGRGTLTAMPVPPKRVKELAEGTVDHRASKNHPGLQEITIRWRGAHGYMDAWAGAGDENDERIHLCRIEHLGDDAWGSRSTTRPAKPTPTPAWPPDRPPGPPATPTTPPPSSTSPTTRRSDQPRP